MSKNDFGAAIKQLQSLAGHSSEQFETIQKGLLAMAENLERDTHFAHGAHLLFNELYERGLIARPDIRVYRDNFDGAAKFQNEVRQHGEQIIAQFAYDLLYHFVTHSEEGSLNPQSAMNAVLPHIPDLTSWSPPESSPAPEP